jgi:tetratricopeptide (TPR) repeat protein
VQEESIPTESVESETVPEQAPTGPLPGVRRTTAVLTACAVLALPVGYLLLHHSTVNAGTPAPGSVPPAQSIAMLEAQVRAQPTAANRINLSLAYINGGEAARAVPVLNAVLAENSNNAIAWNNLCVAHTLQQDYATGIDDCHHALAAQPGFQLAQNNLKWASDERDATIKTITAQEQTDTSKRDAAFYLDEGMNFLHVGNYDEAVHAWRRALDMDPRNAAAANDIGIAIMFQKHPAAAIPWFQKAIALDPSLQLAKNNLAWARQQEAKAAK